MGKINGVQKETDHRFLNYYTFSAENKAGHPKKYFVASRAEKIEDLKALTHKNIPDGVTVYMLYGESRDRVVLVRQYRFPVDAFVYEFPSGIVERGESYREAAVREVMEETGLTLTPLSVPEYLETPRFQTVGMTDESCALVYGFASGTPTSEGEEESEEIEVVLADKAEVRRILEEEYVASGCAYHLAHFLADDDPFAFLEKLKEA